MTIMYQVIDPSIEQQIDQLAKQLAVASLFAQHPQQEDDYERVLHGHYVTGRIALADFYLCEDYLFEHADVIIERLVAEYEKLKGFAIQVLTLNQQYP